MPTKEAAVNTNNDRSLHTRCTRTSLLMIIRPSRPYPQDFRHRVRRRVSLSPTSNTQFISKELACLGRGECSASLSIERTARLVGLLEEALITVPRHSYSFYASFKLSIRFSRCTVFRQSLLQSPSLEPSPPSSTLRYQHSNDWAEQGLPYLFA